MCGPRMVLQGGRVDQVLLVGVVAIAILIASLCRRFDVAAPLPLVAAGILLGLVPRMADLKISPQVVLDLALPPLLFAAALQTSYLALRAYTRLLLLLSVGLVVVTAVVVGVVAHQVLPGLPLAAAIALGAVLAPTDAVTATVIGRRSGLPRKALTLLEGESLMNDGTALTVFRVAVVAATAGSITAGRTAAILTLSVAGGIAIGLLGGFGLRWLLERYDDALVENTITLLAPFAVYFVAEGIQASGFLAVVIAGLILAHSSSSRLGYATRLQLSAVWSVLTFLLESLAFLVVGLQVPSLISRLDVTNLGTERLLVAFVVIFAAVIVTRFVWVFPATFLPRWSSRVREHEKPASWQAVAVVAWAGMRGPVSLFAALGLPLTTDNGEPFPLRDVLVLITAMVVVGGLLLQSLTLGPLIRRLGVV